MPRPILKVDGMEDIDMMTLEITCSECGKVVSRHEVHPTKIESPREFGNAIGAEDGLAWIQHMKDTHPRGELIH